MWILTSFVSFRFGQIKLFGTGKTLEGMAAGFISMLVASIMLDTQLTTEPLDFQGKNNKCIGIDV